MKYQDSDHTDFDSKQLSYTTMVVLQQDLLVLEQQWWAKVQEVLIRANVEIQVVIFLLQEQEQLYSRSSTVSSSTFDQPSRYIKLWVKMLTPLIKNFF